MGKKPANSIEPLYRVLIIIFSFASLVLIALIMYFALSQATIVITPSYQDQRIGFAVQITGNESENGQGKIFGEVKEVEVSATKKFPATTTIVNSDKVSGEVTLINNSAASQVLIATTRLLTADNKLYRLDKTITVPAKGKITANATADAVGDEFATGAEKLTIPGLNAVKQALIWAETAGFGKQSRTVNELTQETINQARAKFLEELNNQAQAELKKQLANPDNLLTEALQTTVIEEKNNAKINSSQAEFTMNMKIKVKGLAIDKEALQKIATANLKDIYPNAQTILKIKSDSFTYQTTFLDTNTENLLAQVKGEYELEVVNIQIDKEQLKGMRQSEAIAKLKNLSGVKEVSIYLPFWTKYLPALSEKINIQVKQ